MNTLIKDIRMIRMVSETEGVIRGNIGICGDRILFAGEGIPKEFQQGTAEAGDFRWDKVIDGADSLAIPGLVNAHTHAPMSILRNYGNDLALMDWLNEKIFPAEDRMDAACGYWGSMLTVVELIRSGCTAFEDQYMFAGEIARAAADSGVRANVSRGLVGDGAEASSIQRLMENIELFDQWNGQADGRIKIDFGPHAPFTCGDGLIEKVIAAADEKKTGIHIHLCETRGEVEGSLKEYGRTPIERMEALGLFSNPRVVAAHCVHLTDHDIEILKKHDVNAVHNPSSNLKLASGFAPVARLNREGINVALGTDGSSSNNNVNMCEELHIAALLSKCVAEDPSAMPAYEVIRMATLNGARALGIEQEVGSLEAGKKADIAILDISGAHWQPQTDLMAAIPYSMNGTDVKTVLCNGTLLMEDRILLTIDEQEVIAKVNELTKHVLNI